MATDVYAFQNMNEIGPDCEPDCPVPMDVWANVLDLTTKEPTGYVKRRKWRTYKEVYYDLLAKLDVWECPECGETAPKVRHVYDQKCPTCGEDMEGFIDEYFSLSKDYPRGAGDKPIRPFWRVACFAVTGGSEGHYIHVGAYGSDKPSWESTDKDALYEDWFIGKTFRGMGHAYRIAHRCAELLGL